MTKLTTMILAIGLGSAIFLAGCSSNENKVSDGVNHMLVTAGQLSKATNSGDQTKVKEIGPKLEDEWSSFEDDVKKDHKDLYEKVEKYLDPTVAGSKAPALDKKALKTLNNHLTEALNELDKNTK